MRIEVTASDIRYGIRRECLRCPIARALKRATGEDWSVGDVNGYPLRDKIEGVAYWPNEVCAWIEDFDHERVVQPFAFELDI